MHFIIRNRLHSEVTIAQILQIWFADNSGNSVSVNAIRKTTTIMVNQVFSVVVLAATAMAFLAFLFISNRPSENDGNTRGRSNYLGVIQ
jgi:hypothetical protein